jgi:hypothetical protein
MQFKNRKDQYMKTTKPKNRTIIHETQAKDRVEDHHFVSESLHELIQKKAHEIYSGRGHLPGNDLTDWLEAEKIVRGELGSHFAPKVEIEEHIRKKAYEIYEGRGCLPDGDMSDWVEAEKIVLEKQA